MPAPVSEKESLSNSNTGCHSTEYNALHPNVQMDALIHLALTVQQGWAQIEQNLEQLGQQQAGLKRGLANLQQERAGEKAFARILNKAIPYILIIGLCAAFAFKLLRTEPSSSLDFKDIKPL